MRVHPLVASQDCITKVNCSRQDSKNKMSNETIVSNKKNLDFEGHEKCISIRENVLNCKHKREFSRKINETKLTLDSQVILKIEKKFSSLGEK